MYFLVVQINYFSDTNKNKAEKERKKILKVESPFLDLKLLFIPFPIIIIEFFPCHRFSMTRKEGMTAAIQ